MQRIEGVVQHYAWGDPTFIPTMLGLPPDGRPWAELWLGTHPNGPARLLDGTPLSDVTGPLPYLLKVLAAAEPLSMQVHPDAEQARDGHARGVYGDDRPKPELLVALTRFEALCGFRPVDRTHELLVRLGPGGGALDRVVTTDGPAAAMAGLYRGTIDTGPVLDACERADGPEAAWVRRLHRSHPGDPSVAATLLLHHVVLRPGEALRLDAGTVHAYLGGAGIELMGASDNVVRAGLTVKPVDVDELLRIVDPRPVDDPVIGVSHRHDLPAAGVALVRLAVGERHTARSDELAVDVDGSTWHLAPGDEFVASAGTWVVAPCD